MRREKARGKKAPKARSRGIEATGMHCAITPSPKSPYDGSVFALGQLGS